MEKKVLVLGGTGAMGIYLVPELLKMDYRVDVVALNELPNDNPKLRYLKCDAKDITFLKELLKNEYCCIVDFMVYKEMEEFEERYRLFLDHTDHYFYLSSYRIYGNREHPITENSPRLLETETDPVFLTSNDYALYKAKQEDVLRKSGYTNWTILRPAITYSRGRYQLTTLEAGTVVARMLRGQTIVLPEPAMKIQATMSWAGDVARMISRLVLNPDAMGETYTVSTSEHHTWEEVAQIYGRIGGLKYITTDTESFLNIVGPGNIHSRQQLIYDRYFDRIVDNSKILTAAGMKQNELMTLEEGLLHVLAGVTADMVPLTVHTNARMDAYLAALK